MKVDLLKIIVVEDDALIADSIKILLESYGYEISAVCNSYNEALIAVNNNEFDLLLTDINLGNGTENDSGIEVAEYCKHNFKKPIIFLTAYSDKNTITKCAKVMPAGYLVKPINENTLFATIQLALENYKNNDSSNNVSEVDYLYIKVGKTNYKIFWKEIFRIEAIKNYVKLYSTTGQSNLLIRSTLLNFIRNILPANLAHQFAKISRSEMIAKDIILKYNKNTIETTQGIFELGTDFKIS